MKKHSSDLPKALQSRIGSRAASPVKQSLLVTSGLLLTALVPLAKPVDAQTTQNKRVAIGGGGLTTAIRISPTDSNLVFARSDTAGLFRWNSTNSKWENVTDFFPIASWGGRSCAGLVFDTTSGSQTIYAGFGGASTDVQSDPYINALWKSTDRGTTWTRIWDGAPTNEGPRRLAFAGNGPWRHLESIALDPANPNVLYVGTRANGLHRTFNVRDASPSFSKISGAPVGYTEAFYNAVGVRLVWIDPRSGNTGSGSTLRKSVVYLSCPPKEQSNEPAPTAGKVFGLFRSTDGGENFTHLGGPELVTKVVAIGSTAGEVLCSTGDGIKRVTGTTWTTLPGTAGKFFWNVEVDPSNSNKIIASGDGAFWSSTNGGQNWTITQKQGRQPSNYLDNGFFYPGDSQGFALSGNSAWISDSFTIHQTSDAFANPPAWSPRLSGLENTVCWAISAPAAGNVLYVGAADVNGWLWSSNVDTMPSDFLATKVYPNDSPNKNSVISDVEWSRSNPSYHIIARSTSADYYAGYGRVYTSTDGGSTWTGSNAPAPEAGRPDYAASNPGPARIAVSSTNPNKVVYFGAYRNMMYSSNGFSSNPTWARGSGIPDNLINDIYPYSTNQMRLESDAANGDRFYAVYGRDQETRVYVSDNAGATWTKYASNLPTADDGPRIATCKNSSGGGELWVALSNKGLWRSTDGGRSFARFRETDIPLSRGVTFGKPANGSSTPAMFIAGTVKINGTNTDGVFMSNDMGQSFTRISEAGKPIFGGLGINEMTADWRTHGRVYFATSGAGVVYLDGAGGSSSSGPNLISNPSFDAENYDTQSPSGWSEWSDLGGQGASYSEANGGSASGARHGTHWFGGAYRVYTYQYKNGLANGLYTARCKAKTQGGQTTAQFEVKDYGGSTRAVSLQVSGAYQTVEIKDINVTTGQATIGFWSVANNQWAYFDDVEFFKQ